MEPGTGAFGVGSLAGSGIVATTVGSPVGIPEVGTGPAVRNFMADNSVVGSFEVDSLTADIPEEDPTSAGCTAIVVGSPD